jgi:hypothetical protein
MDISTKWLRILQISQTVIQYYPGIQSVNRTVQRNPHNVEIVPTVFLIAPFPHLGKEPQIILNYGIDIENWKDYPQNLPENLEYSNRKMGAAFGNQCHDTVPSLGIRQCAVRR